MEISVSDAKGRLTDLVRRAEAGDEIILTRRGHAAVRMHPLRTTPDHTERGKLLQAVRLSGTTKASPGPSAARSQDFLYREGGRPE